MFPWRWTCELHGEAIKLLGDISTVVGIKTRATTKDWPWFFDWGARLSAAAAGYAWPQTPMLATTPRHQSESYLGRWVQRVLLNSQSAISPFLAERFNGNLKLIITAPVSKFAYVAGAIDYSSMIGAGSVIAILGFALASGIDIDPTWTFLPVVVLSVLFLAGVSLFITSFASSLVVGSMLANIVGIILAMVSPVFFTMEQVPLLLRWLGYVSPLRYAADGLSASLTGAELLFVKGGVIMDRRGGCERSGVALQNWTTRRLL